MFFFFLPASETGLGTVNSPALDMVQEADERLPQVPLQEHVFSECSRERILGLLAAMLPPAYPVCEAGNKHFLTLNLEPGVEEIRLFIFILRR